MLTAEAKIPTERASRYLNQLCRHVDKAAHRQPQMQAHVEWSADRGVIDFDWGRCTLHADPGVLTLRAEASDEEALRRIEHRLADLLERIGRRDGLTVTWTAPSGAVEHVEGQAARHTGGGHDHD